MRIKLFIFLAILTLTLSTACSGFVDRRKELKSCDFNVKGVKIENIGLTSLTLKLNLDIYNPNLIDVVMDKLDVDIWINDTYLGKSINEQKQEIKTGTSKTAELIFHIEYTGAYKVYKDIRKGEKSRYRFKGTVYFNTIFGDIGFPVEKETKD